MPKIPRSALALVVIVLLFVLIWPKIHIVLWVQMSFWQALLVFGGAALVLFLLVDHLINRTRA